MHVLRVLRRFTLREVEVHIVGYLENSYFLSFSNAVVFDY